jgi:hypothetical protein
LGVRVWRKLHNGEFNMLLFIRSRDSSVGIAMGYGLDDPGSIPGRGKIFLFSKPALRLTQPSIQWVQGGSLTGRKAVGA